MEDWKNDLSASTQEFGYWILEIGNWNDGMMESCLPSDWDGILTCQVSKASGRQDLLGLTTSNGRLEK
jgi:hypothetical protein